MMNKPLLTNKNFILSLTLHIVFIFSSVSGDGNSEVCQTSECFLSAMNINNSLNTNVDPCENFYAYACGNWPKFHPQPSLYHSISTIERRRQENNKEILAFLNQSNQAGEPKLLHKTRSLFSLCLDTDAIDQKGLTPLRNLLRSVNLSESPPLLTQNKNFDYVLTHMKVQKYLGVNLLFHVTVSSNPYNTTRNLLLIQKPQFVINQLPTLLHAFVDDVEHLKEINQNRNAYMTSVMSTLCKNSTADICAKLLTFDEALIISSTMEKLDKYNQGLFSVLMKPSIPGKNQVFVSTLGKLQNDTDNIAASLNTTAVNWTRIVEILFEDVKNVTVNLDQNLEIGYIQDSMESILKFIHTFTPAEHELGLWWTVVDSIAPYSYKDLRDARIKYMSQFTGHQEREKWCVNTINQILGMPIGHYYRVNPKYISAKYQATEMIKNIKEVFQMMMTNSTWMDEKTKKHAIDKIQSTSTSIAFSDNQKLYDDVDSLYNDINVTDSFLDPIIQIVRKDNLLLLSRLYKPNNFSDYNYFSILPPVLVNAFYIYERNALVVPAGILGFPLSGNGLKAMDYGAIGTIMGHEMTHGFDVSGRRYNSEGNLEDWWEPQVSKMFESKASCYINHYNYRKNNGTTTLAENIADNVGFKEALLAYRFLVSRNGSEPLLPHFENFTHEQLFTLSFANTWCESSSVLEDDIATLSSHSMNAVRVNGVASNSKEFSEIWSCKKGSQMFYDDTKCTIW